ncbi:hypothetical protein P9272_34895 [Mesorhizobium sp. WSM4976]|uniref:hypothetical protein n=1 Tax=Mesorhizobium sp. WSM4976 TaxID=3038549 RepID=UPI002415FDB2|nr:hypothetical protein [Mesorhizobium sp. WSM4976]MDG4898701.1 hypothetical protein [Mesorhizobium sp. WSM4976]
MNKPAATGAFSFGVCWRCKEKSKDISDLVIDMESVAVSKADTKVEDVPAKKAILGEAYIARSGKTGAPDRFVSKGQGAVDPLHRPVRRS